MNLLHQQRSEGYHGYLQQSVHKALNMSIHDLHLSREPGYICRALLTPDLQSALQPRHTQYNASFEIASTVIFADGICAIRSIYIDGKTLGDLLHWEDRPQASKAAF